VAAPTPPYATSTHVAILLKNLIQGISDFTEDTSIKKSYVETIISWVSAQIDMQLQSAGYVVPLAEISGETWPTSQTAYLTLVACTGAASYITGAVMKPAPAVGPGREGSAGNVYQAAFESALNKMYLNGKTSVAIRAQYYAGTPAENTLRLPSGPGLDYMEGMYDPTRYQGVWAITDEIRNIQRQVLAADHPWDYLYTMFNVGMGL